MRTPLVLRILAVAALLLWGSGVQATADAVRIWEKSAGEQFPQFLQAMQQNGWADEEGFNPLALGVVAHDYAKKNGHLDMVPASNRDQRSYAAMFLRWNAVADKNRVSIPYFRTKGTGVGWWLPATETPMAKLRAVNDTLTALQTKLDRGETLTASQFDAMEEQLTEVRIESNAADQELQTALTAVESGLAALKRGELTPAMQESITKQVQGELQAVFAEQAKQQEQLDALTGKVNGHENRLTKLEGWFDGLENRVSANETDIGSNASAIDDLAETDSTLKHYLAFVALGALLFGLFFIGLGLWQRRTAKQVRGLKNRQGELGNGLSVLRNDIDKIGADSDSTKELVEAATGASHDELSKVEIDYGDWPPEKLADMPKSKENAVYWSATYEGVQYCIMIWRDSRTKAGLVKTNLQRSVDSGQLSDPIAIKRLTTRVKLAVLEGRAQKHEKPREKLVS